MNKELEKKIMSDISYLKKSVPSAERLLEIKPQIDSLYDKKKELREQINKFKDDIAHKETEIESIRKQFEEAKVARTDQQEQIAKFEEQI
jgi:chromosome segregation ATPase